MTGISFNQTGSIYSESQGAGRDPQEVYEGRPGSGAILGQGGHRHELRQSGLQGVSMDGNTRAGF